MSIPQVGAMIGNVRLEKLLGAGVVRCAYRGHHTTLGIDVVVKILRPERRQLQAAYYYELFRREAHITARFDDHPNIVRVLDFGQYQQLPYIILDWVDGFSLRAYSSSRATPLDERTILKVLWFTATALESLQTAGIVHRNLNPATLFITRKGQLKVASLGLAVIVDPPATATPVPADPLEMTKVILLMESPGTPASERPARLTTQQVIGGAIAYMAPENFIPAGGIDVRSDIYALGVIGYQLIFGCLPYQGNPMEIINGHLRGQARFDLPTHCSKETIDIVHHMVRRDPETRPQSAKDIATAIRPLLYTTRAQTREPGAASRPMDTASARKQALLADGVQSMERRLERPLSASERTPSRIFHKTLRMMERLWDPRTSRAEKQEPQP